MELWKAKWNVTQKLCDYIRRDGKKRFERIKQQKSDQVGYGSNAVVVRKYQQILRKL